MTPIHKKSITDDQWSDAANAYELGLKPAVEIAEDLGVHPSTVSREFKRRGCKKWGRAPRTDTQLEILLNHHARRKQLARQSADEAKAEAFADTEALIHDMMRSLVAASKAGDLTLAVPMIELARKAMKSR